MHNGKLRVFFGPDDVSEAESALQTPRPDTVTVKASDVISMLQQAIATNRNWLQDFADDEMTITSDLYDVLVAHQYYHRPSA